MTKTRSRKDKADLLARDGQLEDARALYAKIVKADDTDVEALVKLATVDRQLGRYQNAERLAHRAATLQPRLGLAHYALGAAQQCLGKSEAALASYSKAIALQPGFPDAHYLLGNTLHGLGRLSDAVTSYRRAIALRAEYFEALADLGAALTLLGDDEKALEALQRALQLRPEAGEVLANLASLQLKIGSYAEAVALFRRAIQVRSDSPAIAVQFAATLERAGQIAEAREILRSVPENERDPSWVLVDARLKRREGLIDGAIVQLEETARSTQNNEVLGDIHVLLAQLHDEKENSAEAFHHLVEGNRRVAARINLRESDPPPYLATVKAARALLTPDLTKLAIPEYTGFDPVFLVGFPRSGTTLLEQILAGHPNLQAAEERPILSTARRAFDEMASKDEATLASLSREQIETLRRVYVGAADRFVARRPGAIFVDKFPLNIVWAHFAWRLFPKAKFILALRHPYDCCLSSLLQDFSINDAMASFLFPRHAAETYAAVMGLWKEQTQILPISYHPIRYEDVIADVEGEARRLLAYLEMEWHEDVLRHTDTALARDHIRTPSYHQVTRPIYRRSAYRWQRYAEQLASSFAPLEPFVETFGYADGKSPA